MDAVRGTFRNGQIVLDAPGDWPEGCRVRVVPETGSVSEADTAETPEQLEEWLRWYRALEPLELTPREEAELAEWRRSKKDYSIANCGRRAEGLFP